jgi:hypothetical protein
MNTKEFRKNNNRKNWKKKKEQFERKVLKKLWRK